MDRSNQELLAELNKQRDWKINWPSWVVPMIMAVFVAVAAQCMVVIYYAGEFIQEQRDMDRRIDFIQSEIEQMINPVRGLKQPDLGPSPFPARKSN